MPARRAKIVCTLGPAVDSPERIRELIAAGMDVARLNFSHGSPEGHARVAEWVRRASHDAGRPVAILQDLCGPKIRTGIEGPTQAEAGATLTLTAGERGSEGVLAVGYATLAEDVHAGDRILLGDGHVELRVERVDGARVVTRVEHGGGLRERMGVNLPSGRVRGRALTDKDRSDLVHGLEIGADYVALSFVRSVEDVHELRALCEERGRPTPIVAKVETPSAVEHIDAIARAADAVMVARGDLGVELPPETVPIVQREIIGSCRLFRRPVIVATEMLQSMVDSPRPTRAESNDVASAVFGGADAVMLSAETATGKYPFKACQMMDRIIRQAEGSRFYAPVASPGDGAVEDAIADAACEIARSVGAKVLVALTTGGATARRVSKARPPVAIIAFSPEASTLRRLALYWGVVPHPMPVVSDLEAALESTKRALVEAGLVERGERFVLVHGAPMGTRGSTNSIRVEVAS